MSFSFENVDLLIDKTTECIEKVNDFDINDKLYVGVDLGTAYIVLVVVDSAGNPIATELQYAEVVRDGLVVDYSKACSIVRELKEKLENRLGVELVNAAIAMPPGVNNKSVATHRYVAESAGFEVLNVIEEPEAANNILNISNIISEILLKLNDLCSLESENRSLICRLKVIGELILPLTIFFIKSTMSFTI